MGNPKGEIWLDRAKRFLKDCGVAYEVEKVNHRYRVKFNCGECTKPIDRQYRRGYFNLFCSQCTRRARKEQRDNTLVICNAWGTI